MDNKITEIEEYFNIVGQNLGKGFSECVYQEAICVMLRQNNINYSTEVPIAIRFMNTIVGNVRADIIIDSMNLIIECKAIEGNMKSAFISQLINYMEITNYPSGLLINFNQNPSKSIIELITVTKDSSNYIAKINSKELIFDKLGNQKKSDDIE